MKDYLYKYNGTYAVEHSTKQVLKLLFALEDDGIINIVMCRLNEIYIVLTPNGRNNLKDKVCWENLYRQYTFEQYPIILSILETCNIIERVSCTIEE